MRIGMIGSGVVAQVIGGKLVSLGHDVVLGTRNPADLESKKGPWAGSLAEWLGGPGRGARVATFAEAAAHGELLVNATSGTIAVDALKLAGRENLAGKVLLDLSNELDGSKGFPPVSLATAQAGGSVGARLQQAFPDAHVVKTLNTMTASVMVDPGSVGGGDHTVFVCGNDASAKQAVSDLLRSFGWRDVLDLGDIKAAAGLEMIMPLWLSCMQKLGNGNFNFKVVR